MSHLPPIEEVLPRLRERLSQVDALTQEEMTVQIVDLQVAMAKIDQLRDDLDVRSEQLKRVSAALEGYVSELRAGIG